MLPVGKKIYVVEKVSLMRPYGELSNKIDVFILCICYSTAASRFCYRTHLAQA